MYFFFWLFKRALYDANIFFVRVTSFIHGGQGLLFLNVRMAHIDQNKQLPVGKLVLLDKKNSYVRLAKDQCQCPVGVNKLTLGRWKQRAENARTSSS